MEGELFFWLKNSGEGLLHGISSILYNFHHSFLQPFVMEEDDPAVQKPVKMDSTAYICVFRKQRLNKTASKLQRYCGPQFVYAGMLPIA